MRNRPIRVGPSGSSLIKELSHVPGQVNQGEAEKFPAIHLEVVQCGVKGVVFNPLVNAAARNFCRLSTLCVGLVSMCNHAAVRHIRLLENHGCCTVPEERQGLPIFRPDAFAGNFCRNHENPLHLGQLEFVRGKGECGHKTQARCVHMKRLAARLVASLHGGQSQSGLGRDDLVKPASSGDEHIDVGQSERSCIQRLLGRLRTHGRQGFVSDLMPHPHPTVLHAPSLGKPVLFFNGGRRNRLGQVLTCPRNSTGP